MQEEEEEEEEEDWDGHIPSSTAAEASAEERVDPSCSLPPHGEPHPPLVSSHTPRVSCNFISPPLSSAQLSSGMGWSSTITGHQQQQTSSTTSSVSQWGPGTAGGMGTGPLLMPSGMGMGPPPTTSMMGEPLMPQRVGVAPQIQGVSFPRQPTPGDNPFADNNNSLL